MSPGGHAEALRLATVAGMTTFATLAELSALVGQHVATSEWVTVTQEHINLFAQASSALALSVIGGTLVGLQVRGLRRQVALISAGKLLLHPLLVFAVATVAMPQDQQDN